jgi:tRNA pseudouridine38-40 synthase
VKVSYDGTPFHGWAWQPEVPTVEGALKGALAKLLNRSVATLDFQGASRTDAGVHALGQRATFSVYEDRTLREIVRGLNGLTPDTIRIDEALEVPEGFNARHDSRGKHYRFRIYNARFPHPLELDRTWHVRKPLDATLMHQAAQDLLGTHDFTSFRASDCQAQTTVREMTRVDVVRHGDEVVIDVEGTAFLKYMVRNFVGTLVEIGRGKMPADAIPSILAAKDRQKAGPTAEPQGLTLLEVFYDL